VVGAAVEFYEASVGEEGGRGGYAAGGEAEGFFGEEEAGGGALGG